MKNVSIPFRGSIPQNLGKIADGHPDFAGILNIELQAYEGAAWLNESRKGRPYVAFQLTNKSDSHEDKIRFVIWQCHGRASEADPHFEAIVDISEQKVKASVWIILNSDHAHRLDLSLEPITLSGDLLPEAAAKTQERLESFVRSNRAVPAVPDEPESTSTKSQPNATSPDDNDPTDIPF
jgi:hypothetical protein